MVCRIRDKLYLYIDRRKGKVRKCVVCEKILFPRNKSGLCSRCGSIEMTKNANAQKVYQWN